MKKAIFVLFCVVFLFGCVAQQDVINLDNRLSRLEIKNADLKKDMEKSGQDLDARLAALGETRKEQDLELRSQSANIHVKIDRLKEELRILNGRIEEIQHRLDQELGTSGQAGGKIGDMVAYNDQRLAQVEKYLNLEPLPKTTVDTQPAALETTPEETLPVIPAPGASPSRQLTDTELYVTAKQAYDQGKYQEARNGFETMLKMYPDSNRADNAQFWIGDTYYQERWYEKAILEYQKVIEKYPQGNKVAAAMLKQGFAFLKLGDNASARLTLKDLVNKYPSSNEAAVAKQKLSEL